MRNFIIKLALSILVILSMNVFFAAIFRQPYGTIYLACFFVIVFVPVAWLVDFEESVKIKRLSKSILYGAVYASFAAIPTLAVYSISYSTYRERLDVVSSIVGMLVFILLFIAVILSVDKQELDRNPNAIFVLCIFAICVMCGLAISTLIEMHVYDN